MTVWLELLLRDGRSVVVTKPLGTIQNYKHKTQHGAPTIAALPLGQTNYSGFYNTVYLHMFNINLHSILAVVYF